jgi:hypothetical protein
VSVRSKTCSPMTVGTACALSNGLRLSQMTSLGSACCCCWCFILSTIHSDPLAIPSIRALVGYEEEVALHSTASSWKPSVDDPGGTAHHSGTTDFISTTLFSFHAYTAKAWGITLFKATVALLGFHTGGVFLWMAILIGISSNLDGLAIKFVLPEWQRDVPSVFHALKIRRTQCENRLEKWDVWGEARPRRARKSD